MQDILRQLSRRVRSAIEHVAGEGEPLVRPSQDERFGDYQSNAAMGLAKKLDKNPRDVAAAIVDNLEWDDMCDPPEIAGAGFINFRLTGAYLSRALQAIPAPTDPAGNRLGIPRSGSPEVVVVDLSSPNLAKEMHVGHLRSTIIGDCVARLLEFEGHTVHRENHVGDWGTQFGMLVAHLRSIRPDVEQNPDNVEIQDLESFYVDAKARFDGDDDFKKESRQAVVALQRGDATTRSIWKAFCKESLRHCHANYDRLNVRLIDRGESYYQDSMADVIRRLEEMKSAAPNGPVRDSDGALCVFVDGFTTREGNALPLIARKSDGGFNYATSDLATILHRVETLGATRIVYVVGLPQKQHFEMVFAAVRQLGWVSESVRLEHLAFGSVLSRDGRMFRTREGGTVKLHDLLDEAVNRARAVVDAAAAGGESSQSLSEVEKRRIATAVGIGAVKYFDLAHALQSDYKFDFDTVLSLDGNTAPYMLYACARIRSIGRKAGVDLAALPMDEPYTLEHPAELALAKKILQLAETVETLCRELKPIILTDFLYDLARVFSRFYDKKLGVRVIDAKPEPVRLSRLRLCNLTLRALELGLGLLGIETVDQM